MGLSIKPRPRVTAGVANYNLKSYNDQANVWMLQPFLGIVDVVHMNKMFSNKTLKNINSVPQLMAVWDVCKIWFYGGAITHDKKIALSSTCHRFIAIALHPTIATSSSHCLVIARLLPHYCAITLSDHRHNI